MSDNEKEKRRRETKIAIYPDTVEALDRFRGDYYTHTGTHLNRTQAVNLIVSNAKVSDRGQR